MKFLGYILRNVRRNPVRTFLTVASLAISLFLVMILAGFITSSSSSGANFALYHRAVVMHSQGFASPLPIAMVREIQSMPGVIAVSPFAWVGAKYKEESSTFAQFALDPEAFPTIFSEYVIDEKALAEFRANRTSCLVGEKLANERGWKVGDQVPLRPNLYPFGLDLTIAGILKGPQGTDLRTLYLPWSLVDESVRKVSPNRAGNAGIVYVKCQDAARVVSISKEIDDLYRNSDSPTRTQSEEAFAQMFSEFLGSLKFLIEIVAVVVVATLILVAGNSMAMAMRERGSEIAVLRAIGFRKGLVLGLVLAEAVIVAGLGGLLGAVGSKLLLDVVDLARYMPMVPEFFVPWPVAITGFVASLAVGFLSGVIPAVLAANTSVVNGLRKVV